MHKFAPSLLALAFLAGCSSSGTSQEKIAADETVQMSVPSSCDNPLVIQAFNAQVEGSQYVPTQWQPSPGTDLYDIYQANGIACSYGIQVAEVGGTVLWAKSNLESWQAKKSQWLKLGQVQFDIPGIDEEDAVILKEGSTSADEMHLWGINLLIHGVWIQVNATFLQNIEEATPIIQAAIDSLS